MVKIMTVIKEDTCDKCNGQGHLSSGTECKHCHGKGKVKKEIMR